MGVLEGKVAIVTGSGRGIGREIALMFAREGAKVVVNDLGAEVDGEGAAQNIADEVAAEIKGAGGEAVASYDSVATVEGGEAIFKTAVDTFGGLDILVNNAGILRDRTIFKMTEAEWDAVIAVHLKGHYCCTVPFARYIKETNRRGCRIINFSSGSGLRGNFGQSNYGAAKAGVAGFSRVLALELKKFGCTVNVISPAAATRMTIPLAEARGRTVDPSDIARGPQQIAPAVTWLASEKAQEVTGQIFGVARGNISILQQPVAIKTYHSKTLWTLDELDRAMPNLVQAKREHDAAVKEHSGPRPLED
ncbi:MAG: SDR family NAD(P)-dependent oxidoreductase [Myxococcales bacterium]|nr:SDR family NAD(P)-dependent oxidoreductase [Myxococcales bacterium]